MFSTPQGSSSSTTLQFFWFANQVSKFQFKTSYLQSSCGKNYHCPVIWFWAVSTTQVSDILGGLDLRFLLLQLFPKLAKLCIGGCQRITARHWNMSFSEPGTWQMPFPPVRKGPLRPRRFLGAGGWSASSSSTSGKCREFKIVRSEVYMGNPPKKEDSAQNNLFLLRKLNAFASEHICFRCLHQRIFRFEVLPGFSLRRLSVVCNKVLPSTIEEVADAWSRSFCCLTSVNLLGRRRSGIRRAVRSVKMKWKV